MEEFKTIPGFEGLYMISNLGTVRSIRFNKEKILKPRKLSKGYLHVNLKGKNHTIHRLVASAFISNFSKLLEVNHINGVKTDNKVENLEMCTHSQNIKHAWNIKLITVGKPSRNIIDIKNNIIYKSVIEAALANNLTKKNLYYHLNRGIKNKTNLRYV